MAGGAARGIWVLYIQGVSALTAITINCFLLKLPVDGVPQNRINCFQGNNSGSGAILMENDRQGRQHVVSKINVCGISGQS